MGLAIVSADQSKTGKGGRVNKLWVRLSLAFAMVILIGLVIAASLANWQVNRQFRRFVADDVVAEAGLLDRLSDYYASHHGWGGIDTLLSRTGQRPESTEGGPNRGGPMMMGSGRTPRLPVVIADAGGTIIYDRAQNHGHRLSRAEKRRAAPIQVEGETVGYLFVAAPQRNDLSRAAQGFLAQVNRFFLQAGLIAAGLGILLGLTVARGVAAPLGQLANAARQISRGRLKQQVAVKGPEEVADLAHAFNDMSIALEEGEQLRRNLMADVAHELRTPLSVLQGNLRAILDDVYPLEKSEVSRLYDQTRLLSRLVNDLHELAQAEARQLPLNLQPTNLATLLTGIAETFAPIAESESVALQTDLAQAIPSVEADPVRLRQVLHNLLINALRHTPTGGTINLGLTATAQAVQLTVSDSGEGIPPTHLPYIFNRFYRADPARSRDSGGTGLGLAIARAIVEAHGGQITVTSSGIAGEGSQFTIELPI